MPALMATEDHCKTAADVMAAARKVAERRRQSFQRIPTFKHGISRSVQAGETPDITPDIPTGKNIVAGAQATDGIELTPREKVIADYVLSHINGVQQLAPGVFPPGIADIQRAVARRWAVTVTELTSVCRTKHLVFARQIAMVLCRLLTCRSTTEIGRAFGDRDHTTALYALRKYEWLAAILRDEMVAGATLADWVCRAYQIAMEARDK